MLPSPPVGGAEATKQKGRNDDHFIEPCQLAGVARRRGGGGAGMSRVVEHQRALPHHRTNNDGTASLYLYLDECAFLWTGHWHSPIEVSPGGFGEPIQFIIGGDPDTGESLSQSYTTWCDIGLDMPMPVDMVAWFKDLCRRWLTRALGDGVYEGYAVFECNGECGAHR